MIRAKLTPQQTHNRAVNAVVQVMQKHLIVPKIFVEAAWPNRSSRIDVLAVDRAGAGEIHVVEVLQDLSDERLESVFEIPAHYKYLGLLFTRNYRPRPERLYSADGFGRIGLITFRETATDDLQAVIELRPERFNLDSSIFKQVDRFTARNQPTWEIRD